MAKLKKDPHQDLFIRCLKKQIKPLADADIEQEFMFHPTRKWRFDYAIPSLKVALEVDGGVWVYGRHNRAKSYIADLEKLNAAASMGWLVLRIVREECFLQKTLNLIKNTVLCRQHEREGNS
jgi:very-short-patch-repair endonuclease